MVDDDEAEFIKEVREMKGALDRHGTSLNRKYKELEATVNDHARRIAHYGGGRLRRRPQS